MRASKRASSVTASSVHTPVGSTSLLTRILGREPHLKQGRCDDLHHWQADTQSKQNGQLPVAQELQVMPVAQSISDAHSDSPQGKHVTGFTQVSQPSRTASTDESSQVGGMRSHTGAVPSLQSRTGGAARRSSRRRHTPSSRLGRCSPVRPDNPGEACGTWGKARSHNPTASTRKYKRISRLDRCRKRCNIRSARTRSPSCSQTARNHRSSDPDKPSNHQRSLRFDPQRRSVAASRKVPRFP
jgi:hypothetical protein